MSTGLSLRRLSSRPAFTLVELLVVIAIIGVLMAMTLPAVQSARESGRRTQCLNNLKNIALGSNQHLASQKCLPGGGWGWNWTGDPDRGFGMRQPGGWIYSLLPYLEETALHDLGKDGTGTTVSATKKSILAQAAGTPLPWLHCPTRRRVETLSVTQGGFRNMVDPTTIGRTDYAGSSGSAFYYCDVNQLQLTDLTKSNTQLDALIKTNATNYNAATRNNGVIFFMSQSTDASVRDGMSKTYLCGEKALPVPYYETSNNSIGGGDHEGWSIGFDDDTNRFANSTYRPIQDSDPIPSDYTWRFGSPHLATFNMAFCDGSVRSIPYEIDIAVHTSLAVRADGAPNDMSALP
ncbi:MAG: DUF1559 domain-containing protein [Pirellulales bacterium]